MKLETIALHSGYATDPTTKAAAVPIYQTTSYTFDDTQHGADLFDLKGVAQMLVDVLALQSAENLISFSAEGLPGQGARQEIWSRPTIYSALDRPSSMPEPARFSAAQHRDRT